MSDTIRQLQRRNAALRKRVRVLNARLKAQKRIEFSKLIFVGVSTVTLAVTAFSCILAWVTRDGTILYYLIPAVFAEMASATGFYYNKAKAENQIKIAASYRADTETQNSNEIGG